MQIMKQIDSIDKIKKVNVKFDSSFVWQVAEMLAVSPHFHGQFATCDNWRQGYPLWYYSIYMYVVCIYFVFVLFTYVLSQVTVCVNSCHIISRKFTRAI
jgi:hypothetical protein